ncbi:IS110 family transposase [Legionella longbeachae]|uniref:IS110 family transposase n=1 Tax=Legionella longbeachae TaxID=450 RepID=UPI0001BEBCD6|nr:IS110 family transposase [Legionella longbeachae]VEE01366.1 Transposase [Legionella oakridgensis]HBD7396084.1 IS110 family transposase [Legionella pneumophila]ARM34550.2 IS110 family transposase [Legionella longbeachae]EEZ96161.1 putative IS116/IS110/IS902 family transposase [Legionella longbeachae D-4968]QIN31310.1 IS110 family transposase [Legionella longbeachae]
MYVLRTNVTHISPQHVKPIVQGNTNDKNDALAIVIALLQDNMPSISTKSIKQQKVHMLHRYRENLVNYRTALANRMRGYLRHFSAF